MTGKLGPSCWTKRNNWCPCGGDHEKHSYWEARRMARKELRKQGIYVPYEDWE